MNKLFLIMIGFSILFLAACGGQTLTPEPRVTQAPKLATPLPLVTPRPVLTQTTAPASPTTAMGQIANPASKNCIAKGGKLDIRKDANGGEYGMCVFPNGKECEEWALMRAQCDPQGQAAGVPADSGSQTYTSQAYGFHLTYPGAWSLQEKAATANTPLTIILTRANTTLTVQVKLITDAVPIGAAPPQAGEISQKDTLHVLDQDVPLQEVVLEGKVKSAGLSLKAGSLQFRFQVDNSADPEIPPDVLAEAEDIISSLQMVD